MINERRAYQYCKEDISKIENYDLAISDTSQVWDIHHRTEIWWNCTKKELIENECYYHRKACELIFLTHAEHARLHNKGSHHSEESRKKMSKSMKGKNKGKPGVNKGKTFTAEHRRKMSEAKKGKILTAEHKQRMSEALKAAWERRRQEGKLFIQ